MLIGLIGQSTTGVIVNQQNWTGSKRKGNLAFTYSYKYTVNGKDYAEDSKENKHEIGEKVEVEYLDFCPSISRIK